MYLIERSPKTLDELVTWAEQYLMAHNKKLSSLQSRQENVKNGSRGETRKDPAAWCSVSDVVAKDIVPQNAYPGYQTGVAERYEKRLSCQKCGGYGHEARDCRSRPRNHHTQHPGPNGSKPPPSVHHAG